MHPPASQISQMPASKAADGARLSVLDTGDLCVLIHAREDDPILAHVVGAYQEVDVAVDITQTPHIKVTDAQFQLLCATCGRMFPSARKAALLSDASGILAFHDIQHSWAEAANKSESAVIGSSGYSKALIPASVSAAVSAAVSKLDASGAAAATHVLYIESSSVAVVWRGPACVARQMCALCPDLKLCGTLRVADTAVASRIELQAEMDFWPYAPLPGIVVPEAPTQQPQHTPANDPSHVCIVVDDLDLQAATDVLHSMFHKRAFAMEGMLLAKLQGVLALYGEPPAEGAGSSGSSSGNSGNSGNSGVSVKSCDGAKRLLAKERAAVLKHMRSMYQVSEDASQRVRACYLYAELARFAELRPAPALQFQRRVNGYLIELGLAKKRYSDGYYYFGLTRLPDPGKPDPGKCVPPASCAAATCNDAGAATPSLEQVEEQRERELQTYDVTTGSDGDAEAQWAQPFPLPISALARHATLLADAKHSTTVPGHMSSGGAGCIWENTQMGATRHSSYDLRGALPIKKEQVSAWSQSSFQAPRDSEDACRKLFFNS